MATAFRRIRGNTADPKIVLRVRCGAGGPALMHTRRALAVRSKSMWAYGPCARRQSRRHVLAFELRACALEMGDGVPAIGVLLGKVET